MIEIERSFHSDGIPLSGAFYLPDSGIDVPDVKTAGSS